MTQTKVALSTCLADAKEFVIYDILGLHINNNKDVTQTEIKKAYRKRKYFSRLWKP